MNEIPPTPINIKEVSKIEEFISFFRNKTLDLLKLIILYKTLIVLQYIIIDKVILNHNNSEQFVANIQKNQQAQYTSFKFRRYRKKMIIN